VQLGLIDIGYHNYVAAVIQNMTEKEIILKKGTAVAQLLLIKAKIPQFINDQLSSER
jgi:dUTPase